MGRSHRLPSLLVLGLLLALPGAARAAKAPREAPASTGCPAGTSYAPDGSCSRCAAAQEKSREGCSAERKACSRKCDGSNQKCLKDPKALDCDAASEKCLAACDGARSKCFAAKEKVFVDCHAREGSGRKR